MPDSSSSAAGRSDLVLSLEQTRQSFVLEDVSDTPALLTWAFDLIVQGYLPLSTRTVAPEDVCRDVCDDDYHRCGMARTLVLTGCHPETGEREPLGTVRVTTGAPRDNPQGLPPLETMRLMAPPGGWDTFDFAGFAVDQVAEGGRLAVSPTCRIGRSRAIGLTPVVLRALVEGAFQFAAERYGKTQLWGVLPYYVIDRLEALGMHVLPAPDLRYRVEACAEVFARYDRYWRDGRPRFCRVELPPEGGLAA